MAKSGPEKFQITYSKDKKTGLMSGSVRINDDESLIIGGSLESKSLDKKDANSEREKKQREIYEKKRQELLEKKRQERLKIQATPENAERVWREAIINVEKFCQDLGLKVLFNYSDGRKNGKVKGRALYVIDKEGKNHEIDNFNLDTHELTKVKTVPRLRTEIVNKLLINIALNNLINLLDSNVKQKLNQALNQVGITSLWRTAQRLLNNPPLQNNSPTTNNRNRTNNNQVSRPQSITTPTSTTGNTLKDRILTIRQQARDGNDTAAETLRKNTFKNYLDPFFGRKGVIFEAKNTYAAASLAELFPKQNVLWIKKANLRDSEKKINYIKLVRETDPVSKKSEFYPVDDSDKEIYCRYKNDKGQIIETHMFVENGDVVFTEIPYPEYKQAVLLFRKDPISNKNTRRLLASLDFEDNNVKIESAGKKISIKTSSRLNILGKNIRIERDFKASGLKKEENIKKRMPESLLALQFAKNKLEEINEKFGKKLTFKNISTLSNGLNSFNVEVKFGNKNYELNFALNSQPPYEFALIRVHGNNKNRALNKKKSQEFEKIKNLQSLQKFLESLTR